MNEKCGIFLKSTVLFFLLASLIFSRDASAYEVVYAVNCGGPKHVDRNGIKYKKDDNGAGVASDYGKGLNIARVAPEDQILYQTERYHYTDFAYEVPVLADGNYFVVLKFAEVYFQQANEKVFDVMFNSQHTVVENLDIFARAGRAVAHDEIIPFTVEDGQLMVNNERSDFDGTLVIEFVKGQRDNPKANAILVLKGDPNDFPGLPPIESIQHHREEPQVDSEWGDTERKNKKVKHTSGPRTTNPYTSDESWFMPITVAIAIFLPVLFFLCRFR